MKTPRPTPKFLTVRLALQLLEQLRLIAKLHKRSLNSEILIALEEYVAKYQNSNDSCTKEGEHDYP